MPPRHALHQLTRQELAEFVDAHARELTEEESLSVIDHAFVTPAILQKIAQDPRLSSYYSVRLRLVAHRRTPLMYAAKLVHYLYWFDLVRLSVDVTVPAPVRRAIDTQLLARVSKLTLGERIATARRCSAALIKHFLFDPDVNVFKALLVNQLVREEDLLIVASSDRALPEQLTLLAGDIKWSFRYAIRKALVLNPNTPRAVAAAQLRHLREVDLRAVQRNPGTSVYVRRCIERLELHETQRGRARIE
jgi:hypothetical protein